MITLDDISAGLSGNEFYLEYMPTIHLGSGACIGAEALVRWRRPSGVVMPLDFIPLLENTHLSGLITYWVIETAAVEVGAWLRAHDEIHLSINVPPEILGRGGLAYAATKAGLDDIAHKIVVEVTERGVPDKLGIEALQAAARRGIRVALDDVRVTGANMIVLSRCEVEIIKLDKDVIAELVPGHDSPAWFATLASLLAATKLEVIAEGIESAEQLAMLRGAGVTMAQGYHFSRPLSAQAFLDFFQSNRKDIAALK